MLNRAAARLCFYVMPERAGQIAFELEAADTSNEFKKMAQVITRVENQRLRSEIPAMKKAATRISGNPDRARRFLVKGGFITEKTGKLTKRYGG